MFVSNDIKKMTATFRNNLELAFKNNEIDSKVSAVVEYEYKDDSDHCGLDEKITFETVNGSTYTASYRHNSGYKTVVVKH